MFTKSSKNMIWPLIWRFFVLFFFLNSHLQHPGGVSLYLDSFLSNAVSLKSPLSAPFSFNSISLCSIFFQSWNQKKTPKNIFSYKIWRRLLLLHTDLMTVKLSKKNKWNKKIGLVISHSQPLFILVLSCWVLCWGKVRKVTSYICCLLWNKLCKEKISKKAKYLPFRKD